MKKYTFPLLVLANIRDDNYKPVITAVPFFTWLLASSMARRATKFQTSSDVGKSFNKLFKIIRQSYNNGTIFKGNLC